MIHRPLLCHGYGNGTSASLITVSDSAKHIVQILELLDERKMNYTFPINKTELLLSSGFSLLWQCFELSQDSKLAKDNHKTLRALITLLMGDTLSIATDFQRVAHALVATNTSSESPSQSPTQVMPTFVSDRNAMPAPDSKPKSARRQLQAIASRFSSLTKPHQPRSEDAPRRATVPTVDPSYLSPNHRSSSQLSLTSTRSLPVFSINSPLTTRTLMDLTPPIVNLDYLPLGEEPLSAYSNPPRKEVVARPGFDWAQSLDNMDSSNSNMYDGLFNGLFQDQISQSRLQLDVTTLNNPQDWLDQEWPVSAIDMSGKGPAPQSVLSASEGSITSGSETFSGCGSHQGSTSSGQVDPLDTGSKSFKGIAMPTFDGDAIDIYRFVSPLS
jgi:hypothetical protein